MIKVQKSLKLVIKLKKGYKKYELYFNEYCSLATNDVSDLKLYLKEIGLSDLFTQKKRLRGGIVYEQNGMDL